MSTPEDLAAEVSELISEVSRGFYIGSTQSIPRRWLGDEEMEGHCDSWVRRRAVSSMHELEMVVLTVRKGAAGGATEEYLLDHYHGWKHPRCWNVSKKAIGTCKHKDVWNFTYLVRW